MIELAPIDICLGTGQPVGSKTTLCGNLSCAACNGEGRRRFQASATREREADDEQARERAEFMADGLAAAMELIDEQVEQHLARIVSTDGHVGRLQRQVTSAISSSGAVNFRLDQQATNIADLRDRLRRLEERAAAWVGTQAGSDYARELDSAEYKRDLAAFWEKRHAEAVADRMGQQKRDDALGPLDTGKGPR